MRLRSRSYEIDMLNGPIMPKLLQFAIPLILSSMLQLTFNAADVIVVGRFEGDAALAAVGAPGSLINLMVNLFMGLGVGVNVVVAQNYGARNYKGTSESVHTAVGLGVIGGLIVGVFGVIMCETFLTLMKTPPEVLPLAADYMRIYFMGMPFNMLYNFGSAILRATGDTKRPLTYLTIAGVANVILNLIFIIVFGLGVKGVALATIISQMISAVLVLLSLMHNEGSIHLNWKKIHFHKDKVIRIAKVGLPAGLQGTFFSISNVMIQSTVNSFGAIVVAGNTAASNLEGYIYASMNAIYQATITFTGQNVGAGKPERISKVLREGLILVTGIGLALGAFLMVFKKFLLGIYTVEPEVIAAGIIRSNIIAPTYFMCGMMEAVVGVLRGMGSSIAPMIVSVMGACVFRLFWIFAIFPFDPTLTNLYISYPISWIITLAAHLTCYYLIKKKKYPETFKKHS